MKAFLDGGNACLISIKTFRGRLGSRFGIRAQPCGPYFVYTPPSTGQLITHQKILGFTLHPLEPLLWGRTTSIWFHGAQKLAAPSQRDSEQRNYRILFMSTLRGRDRRISTPLPLIAPLIALRPFVRLQMHFNCCQTCRGPRRAWGSSLSGDY